MTTLLIVAGCQSTPDISADIEDYANNIDDAIALTCDDAGFATRTECSETLGRVDESERQCFVDALVWFEKRGRSTGVPNSPAWQEAPGCVFIASWQP